MAAAVGDRWSAGPFLVSAARELEFLRRSPWELALATWFPWLLLSILVWLFQVGVPRQLPIAVVDEDRSSASRELVRMLDEAPAIHVSARPTSLDEAWSLARALDVYSVVYIPRDLSRDVERGRSGSVVAYYNGSHQNAGTSSLRDIVATVQAFSARVALRDVALSRGPSSLRAGPIRVQTTFLFNPARSTRDYLMSLLFPAILLFALCLSVVGALGRELRDRTAGEWLAASRNELIPAVFGKAAPYILVFTLHGSLSLAWLSAGRGVDLRPHIPMLLLGQVLLYLAYTSTALLFVGATKSMATALSLTSIVAGTVLPYSGVVFPSIEAPIFARAWNAILPYNAYVKLQMQQFFMEAAWRVSLVYVAALAGFVLLPGALGLFLYGRAARDPREWGKR